MKTSRIILAVVFVMLVTGLVFASHHANANAKDPAPGIDKLIEDYAAAFNTGDAKQVAKHYTENAIRVSPAGGPTLGRSAIEKHFAERFATDYKNSSVKLTLGSVEMISDDVAVIEGTYEVMPKSAQGADGKAAPASKPMMGRYLNTVVKKDGEWMIAGNATVIAAMPMGR